MVQPPTGTGTLVFTDIQGSRTGVDNGQCRKCEEPLVEGGSFCPYCGVLQRPRRLGWALKGGAFLVVLAIAGFVLNNIPLLQDVSHYLVDRGKQWLDEGSFEGTPTARVIGLVEKYPVYGIDVSHYQGRVDWEKVRGLDGQPPISFAYVRATMGSNGRDSQFRRNWKAMGRKKLVRGAYHYYRPNEDSADQARNFIERVKLKPGDLPPMLDIEKAPEVQSLERLRQGLGNWMKIVEDHYGVTPALYSYENYFSANLSKAQGLAGYPVWIASYTKRSIRPSIGWTIWQVSESATVGGITGPVDLNVVSNTEAFEALRLR